jgi:dephospho-CoA kinase
MNVIGVVGRNASGKDELLDYLHERCSLPVLSVGDIARELAEEEGVEPTRENLHEISERYLERHGSRYFVERLIERIEEEPWDSVGITGIRTPVDVEALRQRFGNDFLLVYAKVGDPALRFERTQARDSARDPDLYREFLEQDKEEEQLFRISEAIEKADLTIRNDASLEAFHERIDETIIDGVLAAELDCG